MRQTERYRARGQTTCRHCGMASKLHYQGTQCIPLQLCHLSGGYLRLYQLLSRVFPYINLATLASLPPTMIRARSQNSRIIILWRFLSIFPTPFGALHPANPPTINLSQHTQQTRQSRSALYLCHQAWDIALATSATADAPTPSPSAALLQHALSVRPSIALRGPTFSAP